MRDCKYTRRPRHERRACEDTPLTFSHRRAIRRPKVQRLVDLMEEKRQIEKRMEQCQIELDQAFLSATRQLQVALDGRVEDLGK